VGSESYMGDVANGGRANVLHWDGTAFRTAFGLYWDADWMSHREPSLRINWAGNSNSSRGNTIPDQTRSIGYPRLDGITAISNDNVWAAGSLADHALLMHWDGTAWTISNCEGLGSGSDDDKRSLRAVTAIAPNEIWAVGDQGYLLRQIGGPCPLPRQNVTAWLGLPAVTPTATPLLLTQP
jgi:hypothetical protein